MTTITNLSTQRVSPVGRARRLVTSFARPANATAYAAGDVISSTTGALCIGFTEAGASGIIRDATVIMAETDTANLQLIVFDAEPTNFADNTALALVAADDAKIVGIFNLTDARKSNIGTNREIYRTDVGQGIRSYTSTNGQLFGLLVTRSIFTPISAGTYLIGLHVEADS